MPSFSAAKHEFDKGPGKSLVLHHSLVPVNGAPKKNIPIRGADNKPLEEYYKWQFIYSILHCGLFAQDYIGVEVHFPKGSKGAKDLIIDGVIFNDAAWIDHYNNYKEHRRAEDLQWLYNHIVGVIEFKREDSGLDESFTRQIKPAMREKDPSDAYVLGIYYASERVFLFHRRDGKYLRYDEAKNQKGAESQKGHLSLHLPDPYLLIPSYSDLINRVHRPSVIDRSKRGIVDLDTITSISTTQMQDAFSNVLRTLDKAGLGNTRGYEILIQSFALKIYDEKRNERNPSNSLEFYITDEELNFKTLGEAVAQKFIKRMQSIRESAKGKYLAILQRTVIEWKNIDHIRTVAATCANFQDYSFVRSSKSDLYQLIFYNFANKFQQQEKGQFLTPLKVIDFLVNVVNPRNDETVFDPCCGIADFLSLSFVNAQKKADPWKLDEANIYGADVSEEMITLASLNMLLNGDGKAHLFRVPDKGSILWKIKSGDPPEPIELLVDRQRNGNWDDWPDTTRLMKFDVILTNPPFGEDRAYRPQTDFERRLIETYETWDLSGGGDNIDLGIVFLENAYHCLKVKGRLGIVLSNSIAAVKRWQQVREWLIERMRIVALFDLPQKVFADTGANTTIIVAYKPAPKELMRLNEQGYSIFIRDINNVGYEKRTVKRNVHFNPVYRIDEDTFEVMMDSEGNPSLDEDFTRTFEDFRQWLLGQEVELQKLFMEEA